MKKSLVEKGLTVPIQILKADGGTMSLEASMHFPGQTVLSGPAASIMGAIPYAPEGQDAIVLDIGGPPRTSRSLWTRHRCWNRWESSEDVTRA